MKCCKGSFWKVGDTSIRFKWLTYYYMDFPGGSAVKHPTAVQETQVQSLSQEDTLEKEKATHSSTLAQELSWTRSLVGYSPWGH